MCGIPGIWRFGRHLKQVDDTDVRRMIAAIAHRGPDGEGVRVSNCVALAHRRLAILDRSDKAAQPMLTKDQSGALVYNGEVYNYQVLRSDLEREGVRFGSTGDAEVVLQALHQWGPETAIPRFNGMFALAYFDERTKTLWLARDRLGIKPLSISRQGDRLVFGSEDKAVLASQGSTPELDRFSLAQRLMRTSNSNTSSVFRGIDRVEPGTILKLENDAIDEIRYWDPLSNLDIDRILARQASQKDKIDALSGLLDTSVRMHLAADTPVATALSGGVDSGLVTALSHRNHSRLLSFVADPDEGPNEFAAAAMTAEKVGVELRPVKLDRQSYVHLWPKAVYALETPVNHSSSPGMLAIAEQCRGAGVPVLLTGEGADELFGGYTTHKIAARRWRAADPPWIWFRSKSSAARLRRQLTAAPFHTSFVHIGSRERPAGLAAAMPHFAQSQSAYSAAVSQLGTHHDRAVIAAGLYDLTNHLHWLLNRHDRIGMAASVEVRVPFIENAIIDFAMHLPARDRFKRRTSKPLLKKVAEREIPRANIYKRKLGFPMTSRYTEGAEHLLNDGCIADVMRWSRSETDAAREICRDDHEARHALISAEMLARMYTDGQSAEEISDLVLSLQGRGQS